MLEYNQCGCTGIRNCLICRGQNNSVCESDEKKDSSFLVTFWFCPECKHIYEGDMSWWIVGDENTLSCKNHEHLNTTFKFMNGIDVYDNFISKEESEKLLVEINKDDWKLSQSGRRKQDFGPKANFKRQKLKIGNFTGLPFYSKFLVERFTTLDDLKEFQPVELCNLEYVPERGSSIDPHIDDMWLWGDQLVTINVQGKTLLTLSNPIDLVRKQSEDSQCKDIQLMPTEEIQIPLSSGSLLILSKEARTKWFHGVKSRHIKNKRVAMTFRNLSKEFEIELKYGDIRKKVLELALSFDGSVVM